MRSDQSAQSRLGMLKARGEPSVRPKRSPAVHVHAVLLDLHAPAAAVAVLAPRQLAVHGRRGDAQPGRQPVEDAGQARAVGFAGGQESQASQGHRLRVSRSVQNEG